MSAGDLLSDPSAWKQPGTRRRISQGACKVPSGLGVLWRFFLAAASVPATASPSSRRSFMITFGFASTR